MKPASDDHQLLIRRSINQAVGIVDPPGPIAGQIAAQRLGFADPLERIARGGGNQRVDALEGFSVLLMPIQVRLPSIRDKADAAHPQPPVSINSRA